MPTKALLFDAPHGFSMTHELYIKQDVHSWAPSLTSYSSRGIGDLTNTTRVNIDMHRAENTKTRKI